MLSINNVVLLIFQSSVFKIVVSSWKLSFTELTLTDRHRTTEANFTCPLSHQTSVFTCPGSKFTCPGQSDLGLSLPCLYNLGSSHDNTFCKRASLRFSDNSSKCQLIVEQTEFLKYLLDTVKRRKRKTGNRAWVGKTVED